MPPARDDRIPRWIPRINPRIKGWQPPHCKHVCRPRICRVIPYPDIISPYPIGNGLDCGEQAELVAYPHAAGTIKPAVEKERRGEVINRGRTLPPSIFPEALRFPVFSVIQPLCLLARRQVAWRAVCVSAVLIHLICPLPVPHQSRRLFCMPSTCP